MTYPSDQPSLRLGRTLIEGVITVEMVGKDELASRKIVSVGGVVRGHWLSQLFVFIEVWAF